MRIRRICREKIQRSARRNGLKKDRPINNPAAKRELISFREEMQLSVVVPIHNEEPSILPLYDRLTAVLERIRKPYEIIFVDDASTDRSFDLLANLVETDPRLKVIRLRRNFGQTAALAAGFDESQGSVVI